MLLGHNPEMSLVWLTKDPREGCLEASWTPDAFVWILSLAVTFSLLLLEPYVGQDMHETQGVLCVLTIIQPHVILGDSLFHGTVGQAFYIPGVWHLVHAKKKRAESVCKQL